MAASDPARIVHLVSNAHIDPVWLWEWEEGAATAISTFRTAAEICDTFPGFVFNHNEAILYRFVEEYEPELFERIQRLTKEGRWHVMGGWYLQPDCNMPSGESFVRQILLGRRYFAQKLGARPTTAINLDPFGHTRGLVQILAKSGYDSYLVCRPGQEDCPLDADEFVWEGYDGSRVLVNRPWGWYNTPLGKASEKVERYLTSGPPAAEAIILWGVGNHGGGPSHRDIKDLQDLMARTKDAAVKHSTPEQFFRSLGERAGDLPVRRKDLNPWAVGCYTSMALVKQRHRQLENELYLTEKMACAAWILQGARYPAAELDDAGRDLATAEFHDILPGSSIQPVEDMALRLMDHGLEILSRERARAFFALAAEEPRARGEEIPLLVYNPHPHVVEGIVEAELQIHDANWEDSWTDVTACDANAELPTQVEKELSNLNLDWRKRVVFRARLAPSCMNRFDCRLRRQAARPVRPPAAPEREIRLSTPDLEVVINGSSGLMDRYRVRGVDGTDQSACCPLVMRDSPDPWGMQVHRFRDLLGAFTPLSQPAASRVSGLVNPALPAVRVIEDGPVRVVVEAVLGWEDSVAVLRYKIPRKGTEVELELRVHWAEKDRMLKLSFPTPDKRAVYMGQVAFGADELPANGDEVVAQKWVAVVSRPRGTALTIVNDGVYGSDCSHGEVRMSLLRSAAYASHPVGERPLVPPDRFTPRMDQGERLYRFWLNAGPIAERLECVDREALLHAERPMALSFFPHGGKTGSRAAARPLVTVEGEAVVLVAAKRAMEGEEMVLRLFNPTDADRHVKVEVAGKTSRGITFRGYEVKTYLVRPDRGTWRETDLMEEDIAPTR
jgi:alpha-mannosidase